MPRSTRLFLFALSCSLFLLMSAGCNKKQGGKKQKNSDEPTIKVESDIKEFKVISFSPAETLPAATKYPSVQIQFSRPVVALSKLGEPSNKSDIVSIEPELKGVFRWYGTSLLSFESSEEVLPQKVYTVKVSPKTNSINGEPITGQLEYSFHPEELRMVSVLPGYGEVQQGNYVDSRSVPPEVARDILVTFNFPVNAAVVAKTLQVGETSGLDSPAKNLDYTAAQEKPNAVRLTLSAKPSEDKDIELVLPAGSMADEDCYQTRERRTLSFHTLLPFSIRDFDDDPSYIADQYSNPVMYVFSSMLKQGSEADIASHISTSLGTKVSADNVAISGAQLIVHGLPVQFGQKYTLTLEKELSDVYGRQLGEASVKQIEVPEARSFASFKNWGLNILEAQFAPKLVFQHQNVKAGSSYSLVPVTGANGGKSKSDARTETLDPAQIPQNVKVLQAVDLAPVLEKAGNEYHGSVVFNADMVYQYKTTDWRTEQKELHTDHMNNTQAIQVTDLGVTARYAYNSALVLVTSLKSGEPVANADVTVYAVEENRSSATYYEDLLGGNHTSLGKAKTDASGFAQIVFAKNAIRKLSSGDSRRTLYIEAKTKDDRVIFQPDINSLWRAGVYNTGNPGTAEEEQMVTFIFTDRGLYKPGETITFRGIDRTLKVGEYSPYEGKFHLTLDDGSWNPTVYYTLDEKTTANGTFWGKIKLPEDLRPGSYRIRYKRDGDNSTQVCRVEVQFFERLRFEVKSSVPSITYFSGDDISADVSANYLGGGSLAGCYYSAYWSREQSWFSLKGSKFEGYSFGPVQGYDGRTSLDYADGMLNGDGKASISQKTGGEKLLGMPYSYRMEATVSDNANQAIGTVASVLVHPARYYIGLKRQDRNGFPKKGDTVKFNYLCVTPDGSAPGAGDLPEKKTMKLELLREEWKEVQQVSWNGQINTRYVREMVSEEEKEISLSASGNATEISVVPPKGGAYLLRLSAKDNRGRDVITESRFYATSSDWYWFNRDNADEITMTVNKDSYEVGDTAQILMQSPLPKGTYLLTVEREGIISQEVRKIDVPTTVLSIPVQESFVPVMYVTLSSYSVRTGAPKNDYNTPDLDKPKGYFGVAVLNVNPTPKRFDVDIKMDKASYRPGETAKISIRATKNGAAVPDAEVTLMAVDRGVIDLINYHVPDPVEYFYRKSLFPDCVRGGDSRSLLMDPVTYEVKNLVGGDSDGADDEKMQERKNFEPTALFIPDLRTDDNGYAEYSFKLPDSLTAYRVTAVGVNGNNFSLSESELPVANPVSVRGVLPRQLRLGDTGEVGVTISNIDAAAHAVSVSVALYEGVDKAGAQTSDEDVQRLPGAAVFAENASKKISVAGGRSDALMFSIKATKPGWITVEYTVKSDVVNEKILMPLQIEKPYIYETVATTGEVRAEENTGTASSIEKVILPQSAEDGLGELYLQLDPTRLGVLREAINYVFHYPYGCLEQRSSAILPLVAFGKYIKVFGLNSEVKNPKSVARKEISSWGKSQLPDGSFPYWPGGNYANAYVSMRIAEIIGLAMEEDIAIKNVDVDSLAEYLCREADETFGTDGSWSNYFAAHAYYAASCIDGDVNLQNVDKIAEPESVDFETLVLCGLTYLNKGKKTKAAAIMKRVRSRMSLTTRGADISGAGGSYGRWSFFNDQSESFALCLQLATQLDPADSVNGHLVYELLQLQRAGKGGYWTSTAATARVLTALHAYILSNQLEDLNFTAEALINGKRVFGGDFKGVAAEALEETLDFKEKPLASLPRDKEIELTFSKEGTGTLYYTAAMKYAIPAAEQTARDEGICIFTEITDVKTGEVVTADKLVAGNVYREKVYISTTKSREFVAVRAPIPAGCEIMNAAFVTTGSVPEDSGSDEEDEDSWESYVRNYNWGLSYQGIYDAEVQYFWDYFPTGFQHVDFLFRAVRKGTYNTPSATAGCMYQEEIFGRSNGKVWTIE